MRMEWSDELREIVERATSTPTFEEWMKTTGHRDIPSTLSGPLHLRSIMVTLYQRYKRTFGIM